MWLYRTSGCTKNSIVLYDYKSNRSADNPKEYLKEFSGYLHADGYQGYKKLPGITIVGCMAHARCRFFEAYSVLPEKQRKGSTAEKALEYFQQIAAIEDKIKEKDTDNKYLVRQDKEKPILDALFAWAKSITNVAPKSKLGKALHYLISEEIYLRRYLEDGRLEYTNNRAERSIKPFVISRKNWLFCNTPSGAQSAATIFSIIETAKENNLKVFEYLNYIFTKAPNLKPNETIDCLLPWNALEECKVKPTDKTEN